MAVDKPWAQVPLATPSGEIETLANDRLAYIRPASRILQKELVPGLAKLSKSCQALYGINYSGTGLGNYVRREKTKVWRKDTAVAETTKTNVLVMYSSFLRLELRTRLDASAKDLAALGALSKHEHGGRYGLGDVKVLVTVTEGVASQRCASALCRDVEVPEWRTMMSTPMSLQASSTSTTGSNLGLKEHCRDAACLVQQSPSIVALGPCIAHLPSSSPKSPSGLLPG